MSNPRKHEEEDDNDDSVAIGRELSTLEIKTKKITTAMALKANTSREEFEEDAIVSNFLFFLGKNNMWCNYIHGYGSGCIFIHAETWQFKEAGAW